MNYSLTLSLIKVPAQLGGRIALIQFALLFLSVMAFYCGQVAAAEKALVPMSVGSADGYYPSSAADSAVPSNVKSVNAKPAKVSAKSEGVAAVAIVSATLSLKLDLHKGRVLHSVDGVRRVVASNPKVVDVVQVSYKDVYLMAKGTGVGQVTFWAKGADPVVIEAQVGPGNGVGGRVTE